MAGHENEINYKVYDLPVKISGLKHLCVSITVLYPGNVNSEPKMTTGHKHKNAEEVYLFLSGKGKMCVDKKVFNVKKMIL